MGAIRFRRQSAGSTSPLREKKRGREREEVTLERRPFQGLADNLSRVITSPIALARLWPASRPKLSPPLAPSQPLSLPARCTSVLAAATCFKVGRALLWTQPPLMPASGSLETTWPHGASEKQWALSNAAQLRSRGLQRTKCRPIYQYN